MAEIRTSPRPCPHTVTLERNSSSFSLQAQVSAFKTADSRKKLRAKQPQQLRWLASTLGPSCSPLPSTVARASRPVLYGVTAAVWESSWKVLLSRLPLRHNLAGCRGQQRWPYRRRSFLLSYAPHVGQLSLLPAALNRGVAPRVSLAVRSAFSSTICRMRLHRNPCEGLRSHLA